MLPARQLNRIQSAIARRSPRASNSYDGPAGNRELHVQIARRYLDAGCALSPDDIVSACGCQEAITLSLRTVAQPGDVIAIDSPAFYGHLQAIEALGMRALEIPTCPGEGMDVAALRSADGNQFGAGRRNGDSSEGCRTWKLLTGPVQSTLPEESMMRTASV